MTTVIQQVLQAEKSADALIKRAEQQKAQKIAKAREHSLEVFTEKKKGIEKEADASTKQQIKRIEEEKQKIERGYSEEAEKLMIKANLKIGKAASFLLDRFTSE